MIITTTEKTTYNAKVKFVFMVRDTKPKFTGDGQYRITLEGINGEVHWLSHMTPKSQYALKLFKS